MLVQGLDQASAHQCFECGGVVNRQFLQNHYEIIEICGVPMLLQGVLEDLEGHWLAHQRHKLVQGRLRREEGQREQDCQGATYQLWEAKGQGKHWKGVHSFTQKQHTHFFLKLWIWQLVLDLIQRGQQRGKVIACKYKYKRGYNLIFQRLRPGFILQSNHCRILGRLLWSLFLSSLGSKIIKNILTHDALDTLFLE